MTRTVPWWTGHVDPWWDDSFKHLPYAYTPLTNTEDQSRWVQEGYGYFRNLNGMNYSEKQGMPSYAEPFRRIFDWSNQGLVFFKMMPGDALPEHQDQYITYRKIFDVQDPGVLHRCIVFLEDWKKGHYFQIADRSIANWRKGDYVTWNYDVPHGVANIGTEPRYTLQITGMKR